MTPEEIVHANEVDSPWKLVLYASQRIGCPRPIGNARRGLTIRRIREELEAQNWTWPHLTAAVDYMQHRGIKARSIDFVFYHVDAARQNGFMPRPSTTSADELQQAVAQAIYMETDDQWVRRLLAAKGSSLRKVYDMWEHERKELIDDVRGPVPSSQVRRTSSGLVHHQSGIENA